MLAVGVAMLSPAARTSIAPHGGGGGVSEYLSVKVITLEHLFSDTYHFELPYFQRAYVWRTMEVARLLADISEAMALPQEKRRYFLGKIMLAKKADDPATALVDGHQRVMSLTLLFAVLRDLEDDPPHKAKLSSLVVGTSGPRLNPPEEQAAFCSKFVQTAGSTHVELDADMADLSETERNIVENRNYLRSALRGEEWTTERRRLLADFLVTGCRVIVTAVEEEEDAWSFLRVEEETGVDFSTTDSAKWSLLSSILQEDRTQCQRIWERCESMLGADDLYALLCHVRTIKWRRRYERPVEIDIVRGFRLNIKGQGLAFFETLLLPNAERLWHLRKGSLPQGAIGDSPRECAERMSWIHPQLWVPAALFWQSRGRSYEETRQFFKLLERLVWLMRIAGFDPTKQQSRIIHVMAEIEKGTSPSEMRELAISQSMLSSALTNLRSTTFDSKHYDARVLRRVSVALGQDPGPIHSENVTIEHILPRGYAPKVGWRKHFPTRGSVQEHAHRLGNLTFLTAADNQAADTLDWSDKRPILARSRLILSNRLAATADWTPSTIAGRTEEMIRILLRTWDLKA